MPRNCDRCGQPLKQEMKCVLCGVHLVKFVRIDQTPGGFPVCRERAACEKRQGARPFVQLPPPEPVVIDGAEIDKELRESFGIPQDEPV